MVHITNHHEAIISREIWDGVKQQIEERAAVSREGRKHTSTYWFSGKVRCGKCNKPYIVSGGRTKQSRTVRCINRQVHGAQKREVSGFVVGCDNDSMNQISLNACMKYILEHIKVARESIVSDLIDEIKRMQAIDNKPFDVKPLEIKIENINHKKQEAINLVLEGLISKEDLKERVALYDGEILRLTEEINDNRDMNTKHKRQLEEINAFIDEVNKTADTDSDNTELYGELVQEVVINSGNTVDFYLNCVPFGFRMAYQPRQRGPKLPLACDVLSLSAIA